MNYQELLHSPLIPSSVVSLIQKATQHHAPVFIQGESGTGKEMIARTIHHLGDWKYYRFYKMDCKMLTDQLFTDQVTRLLKETHDGTNPATLFLKDVGQLGQPLQLRLLEWMEDGIFQNGVEKKTTKNIRFIASSSENLKEKVGQGKFSKDLYHRLQTFSISLPPLRDRAQEIPAIAQYLLSEHSKKMKCDRMNISEGVLGLLKSYWWPGNLRELEQVILRSAIFSEGGKLTEKDLLFETEVENNAFLSFLKKWERGTLEFKNSNLRDEPNIHTLPLFLMELVHRIKNPLVSVKTFTQLLRDKFDDIEFREQFYRIVTEDVEKIDDVLNGLLNYIKINTPLEKKNTVHSIIEEVLKRHESQIEDKKIKILKKFERDLPETIVHDEQLRYILNVLLHYILPSIPPNGNLGFLTKTFNLLTETDPDQTSIKDDRRYIEIMILFTGFKKPIESFGATLGISTSPHEEALELELRLVQEIIKKNRGTMKFEVNEKQPRTFISLRFPIERRKVYYYPSVNV